MVFLAIPNLHIIFCSLYRIYFSLNVIVTLNLTILTFSHNVCKFIFHNFSLLRIARLYCNSEFVSCYSVYISQFLHFSLNSEFTCHLLCLTILTLLLLTLIYILKKVCIVRYKQRIAIKKSLLCIVNFFYPVAETSFNILLLWISFIIRLVCFHCI